MQQYKVNIKYKLGPNLYLGYWLSRQNYVEHKGKEIRDIRATTDVPPCMSICDIEEPMQRDNYLQKIKKYIIEGLPLMQNEISQELSSYWIFRDEQAIIDR